MEGLALEQDHLATFQSTLRPTRGRWDAFEWLLRSSRGMDSLDVWNEDLRKMKAKKSTRTTADLFSADTSGGSEIV